ncbi:MAG: dipeptide/oligopeptide/nickel ABC transporter ATP-binding protein, partial [Mesorhizobium sp.]
DICSRVFPEPSTNPDDTEHSFRCHFPLEREIAPCLGVTAVPS